MITAKVLNRLKMGLSLHQEVCLAGTSEECSQCRRMERAIQRLSVVVKKREEIEET